MTEKEKKINLNINDGIEFFAHETAVNFGPTQFIIDFKCITPRVDPRSNQGQVLSLKHNVIMVETWHAKQIVELFSQAITRYEKEFGKITKPKAIEKLEKKKSKTKKKEVKDIPSYLG